MNSLNPNLAAAALLSALLGCSVLPTNTQIVAGHPWLEPQTDALSATVYFLRPKTERSMGTADNAVRIDVAGQPLLMLAKGEYVLLHLRAGEAKVSVTCLSMMGPKDELREVTRTRTLSLAPGQTYFLLVEPIDGEFRGVRFIPRIIDLATAKELAQGLRAVGPGDPASLLEL